MAPSRKATRSFLFVCLVTVAVYSLLGLAMVAYFGVYMYYIPHGQIALPLDLDFSGPRNAAYGTIDVSNIPLVHNGAVKYSVGIELGLPTDPHNKALGNFMVRMSRLSNQDIGSLTLSSSIKADKWPLTNAMTSDRLLQPTVNVMTTKPAILPHKSIVREIIETFLFELLYLTGLKSEHESLFIDMGTWEDAKDLLLLVELDRDVHISTAAVRWTVRWTGLRYLMHKYRFTMFVLGTLFFWFVEIVFALLVAWYILNHYGSETEARTESKQRRDAPQLPETTTSASETSYSYAEPELSLLDSLGRDPEYDDERTLASSNSLLDQQSIITGSATLASSDHIGPPTPAATPGPVDDEYEDYIDTQKNDGSTDEDSTTTTTNNGNSDDNDAQSPSVSANNAPSTATSTSLSSGSSNPWRRSRKS